MPLPVSGPLGLSDIALELGLSLSNVSLRSMSNTAGFTTPDAISEFYRYSAYTLYALAWSSFGPCSFLYYDVYISGDGKYYVTNDGGSTFSLMYSVAEFWYEYLYYDPNFMADVFNAYSVNTTSTVINDDGLFLTNCF